MYNSNIQQTCQRCCTPLSNKNYCEECDFILCPDCKNNNSLNGGEYRWALTLIHFYMHWNIEMPLPSFWPKNAFNENLVPDDIVKITLDT